MFAPFDANTYYLDVFNGELKQRILEVLGVTAEEFEHLDPAYFEGATTNRDRPRQSQAVTSSYLDDRDDPDGPLVVMPGGFQIPFETIPWDQRFAN